MEELILKEREFKVKIVELINNSSLPAFIIKPTLKELFEQINLLEQQQYEKALSSQKLNEEENEKTKKQEETNE